jgi:hypothetical protein
LHGSNKGITAFAADCFQRCGKTFKQGAIAGYQASSGQRRLQVQVSLGRGDALLYRLKAVPDGQPGVPKQAQQSLNERTHLGPLSFGVQEKKIEIRARRQLAASIAAERDNGGGSWYRRGEVSRALGSRGQLKSTLDHEVKSEAESLSGPAAGSAAAVADADALVLEPEKAAKLTSDL